MPKNSYLTVTDQFCGAGGSSPASRGEAMYTCIACGTAFRSYNPSPKFCSRNCRGKSERATIDFELAVKRYESGMTQAEVAKTFGVTRKAITNLFERNGYQSRIAAKRDQRGDKNHNWKGEDSGYKISHERLRALKGQPKHCEFCGTTDPSLQYDWANMTGQYDDLDDYKRLCRSCHRKFDRSILNIRHMKEKLNAQE